MHISVGVDSSGSYLEVFSVCLDHNHPVSEVL